METYQDKLERRICWAIIAAVATLVLIAESKGEDAEFWRFKAAAAIAIHGTVGDSWLPPVPPRPGVPQPVPTPKVEAKPIVKMFSATWCGPCQSAKASLKQSSLPFDIEYVDVSNGGQPSWCSSLPGFGWQANGQTRYVLGFPGVSKLVGQWKATQTATAAAPRQTHSTGGPHWTHPRTIEAHLRLDHGVNPGGMSREQMLDLHDALHEGRR